MLVSDIAKIYNTETKIVNQTIKRNIERFPEDFCFQLTDLDVGKFEVTNCDLKK